MKYGYTGKILRVNLSTNEISVEYKSDEFYRKYLGGKGIASYYLFKELEKGVDPLGEENILIFATGVMTGIPASGMSRFVVGAKSPLTEGIGLSEAGGFWGVELKKAGFDALIVKGRSNSPVYLLIDNDKISLLPASHMWNKDTLVCQKIIHNECENPRIKVAQIGIGGENLIRYAGITNGLIHFNGRNGLGAVMGSKNLKAVAVYGNQKLEFKDNETIRRINKEYLKIYKGNPLSYGLHQNGTAGGVDSANAAGILPTRNFNIGEFKDANKISGEHITKTILKKRASCYACAVHCKRIVEVNDKELSVESEYGGPEYEAVVALGSLCGIGNIEVIAKANELCNRFGIDTISTGASIAFLMECYENGALDNKYIDGMDLSFGNENVILDLIEMIARRLGIGDILAEGSSRAAEIIGNGSSKYTCCVKKQELPMHDPRGKSGVGLGYALSEKGADHMVIGHDTFFTQHGPLLEAVSSLGIVEPLDSKDLTHKKVRMYVYLQNWWSFLDGAGICYFIPAPRGCMPVKNVLELLQAATGWDTSLWEAMKWGERLINMARMFNCRDGFDSTYDGLPEKMFKDLDNEVVKHKAIDKREFSEAIEQYYGMMGWETGGKPGPYKLLELDLHEFLK